jgi:hypothetical protein
LMSIDLFVRFRRDNVLSRGWLSQFVETAPIVEERQCLRQVQRHSG